MTGEFLDSKDDGLVEWLNPQLSDEEREGFDPRFGWVIESEEGAYEKIHRMTMKVPGTDEMMKTGLVIKESRTEFKIVNDDQPNGEGTAVQYETLYSGASLRDAYAHMKKDGFNTWPPTQ